MISQGVVALIADCQKIQDKDRVFRLLSLSILPLTGWPPVKVFGIKGAGIDKSVNHRFKKSRHYYSKPVIY
jgi:hypothetical protein